MDWYKNSIIQKTEEELDEVERQCLSNHENESITITIEYNYKYIGGVKTLSFKTEYKILYGSIYLISLGSRKEYYENKDMEVKKVIKKIYPLSEYVLILKVYKTYYENDVITASSILYYYKGKWESVSLIPIEISPLLDTIIRQ